MPATTHLKSLQALEMAIRKGSLKAAAKSLGITPAAIGQRIRALEDYLGTDLLLRGRSGLQPTPELERVVADLKSAFSALDRVTEILDFQRITEIHVVADADWSELWLLPRLPKFRAENPNILFCINGAGDVPARIGAPDCRIESIPSSTGETLYCDILIPVTGPDNLRRLAGPNREMTMEGLPLLHTQAQRDNPDQPGWGDWFSLYGQRREGVERGIHYRHMRLALEAVRQNVGFLVCGLSLMQRDLAEGRVVLPFTNHQHIVAPHPYYLSIREPDSIRPQLQRFCVWLRSQAAHTANELAAINPAEA